MTLYLRKVVKRQRWLDVPEWLAAGDVAGDWVSDLGTSSHTLSVFEVPDTAEKTLLRVASALFAKRDRIEDVEYFLLDDALLARANVKISRDPGTTGDAQVDTWHHNIVEMTGATLASLAHELHAIGFDLLLKEKIAADLARAVKDSARYPDLPPVVKWLEKHKYI